MNWSDTTKAKSDQLNADDLFSAPKIIKITNVIIDKTIEQKGIIYYEGDNGKPYKPNVSMRRVIEYKWGVDEKAFIGRSITLMRDPTVKWGSDEVGGIVIYSMTDMKDDSRFMLTTSRGRKKAYKVEHLILEKPNATPAPAKIEYINNDDVQVIQEWLAKVEMDAVQFCENMKITSIAALPKSRLDSAIKRFEDKLKSMSEEPQGQSFDGDPNAPVEE